MLRLNISTPFLFSSGVISITLPFMLKARISVCPEDSPSRRISRAKFSGSDTIVFTSNVNISLSSSTLIWLG